MEGSNKVMSVLAGVISLVAAAALVVFLTDPFAGKYLFIGLGGGVVGALVGFVSGRSGANAWNRIGLWLGLLTAVAAVLLILWLTPGDATTTEVTEVTEVTDAPTGGQ